MVANRALAPRSKLAMERWVGRRSHVEGLESVQAHTLYRAMDFLIEHGDAIQEAVIYPADVTLALTNVVQTYFDFAAREPTFYRLQLSMRHAPPESDSFRAASALHKEQLELLEGIFTQAAKHHGNMQGRQRSYATTLLGTIDAYIGLALSGEQKLNDQLLYQAVHQFMHGIMS